MKNPVSIFGYWRGFSLSRPRMAVRAPTIAGGENLSSRISRYKWVTKPSTTPENGGRHGVSLREKQKQALGL
jgi:hypothetical protein